MGTPFSNAFISWEFLLTHFPRIYVCVAVSAITTTTTTITGTPSERAPIGVHSLLLKLCNTCARCVWFTIEKKTTQTQHNYTERTDRIHEMHSFSKHVKIYRNDAIFRPVLLVAIAAGFVCNTERKWLIFAKIFSVRVCCEKQFMAMIVQQNFRFVCIWCTSSSIAFIITCTRFGLVAKFKQK